MFERMGADNWTDVHRYAMALLRAIVAWNPDWNSTRWQAMCPHVARLTRILQTVQAVDGPDARPSDPDRLVELLAAAVLAASACDQNSTFDGPERPVKLAAAQLGAALTRIGAETVTVTRRQVAAAAR
jgi:hypothetical protein